MAGRVGFATGMIEPQLFDFYAAWLRQQGWSQQAPTEAMITLPHQRWRKEGVELLIELQPPDERGRTIAWIQVAPLVPVTPTTTSTLTTPPLMAVAISPQNAAQVVELARLDEGQPVWVGPWSPDG